MRTHRLVTLAAAILSLSASAALAAPPAPSATLADANQRLLQNPAFAAVPNTGMNREMIAGYPAIQGRKALAVSEDGIVSIAFGRKDGGEARIAALANCADQTKATCRIVWAN